MIEGDRGVLVEIAAQPAFDHRVEGRADVQAASGRRAAQLPFLHHEFTTLDDESRRRKHPRGVVRVYPDVATPEHFRAVWDPPNPWLLDWYDAGHYCRFSEGAAPNDGNRASLRLSVGFEDTVEDVADAGYFYYAAAKICADHWCGPV